MVRYSAFGNKQCGAHVPRHEFGWWHWRYPPPRVIIQLDDCDRKREAGIPLEVLYVLIDYV